MDIIISKEKLVRELRSFAHKAMSNMNWPHRLRASNAKEVIWDYDGSTKTILPRPSGQTDEFIEIVDLCGETLSETSFSGTGGSKGVLFPDWKEWFLEKVSDHVLIPDTNIIYRHYCSNILFPILGDQCFQKLPFKLPRLTILEIELRCNRANPESKERRLAFYAASEIRFLKSNTLFDLLPLGDSSLITSFPRTAGDKFADAWIRREIHEARALFGLKNPLLLTCDLMNALAAEAEGIECCYFSRSPRATYYIKFPDVIPQLANLIIASAMVFGKIKLEMFLKEEKPFRELTLEGIWGGKTTSEWYSDSLLIITRESTFPDQS